MKYIIVLLFSIGLSAQKFDFECLNYRGITINTSLEEYYQVFVDDYYETTGILLDVPSVILSLNNNLTAFGSSSYTCDHSRIFIQVRTSSWNNFSLSSRLWLVYHELGHDALGLAHTSYSDERPLIPEIMIGALEVLFGGQPNGLNYFIVGKDRMFNNINQIERNCN